MGKKNGICILTSIAVMLVLPAMATKCIQADCGLMVYFLMLFVINPITAIRMGMFAGKNISTAWFQPLLLVAFFVFGGWFFIGMGATDLAFYVILYLVLGYTPLAVTSNKNA